MDQKHEVPTEPAYGALAVLALLLLVSACSPEASDQTTTTTPPTTTEATTSTTAPPTTTTVPATTTTTVPEPIEATEFRAPFTLERGEGWRVGYRFGDWLVEVTKPTGELLVFTTVGAADIDAWVELLTADAALVASEPEAAEVGSLQALTLEVRLADDWTARPAGCLDPCRLVFDHRPSPDEAYGWALFQDHPNRVWLVDVGGVPVAIFAEATEARFEAWVVEVEEALAGLAWTG